MYSGEERVWVTKHKGPWQSVTVLVHRLSEIDTPAFRAFLKEAAASFHANVSRLQTKPEDLMPWKLNGEKLAPERKRLCPTGEDSLGPGDPARELLERGARGGAGAVVSWDQRDAITLRVPGVSRGWAQWRTKEADALDCRFLGKKGQFNLAQVEGIAAVEIGCQRSEGDVLRFRFTDLNAEQAAKLKRVLSEQLKGFRETFRAKAQPA